jgi:hypothetical protein
MSIEEYINAPSADTLHHAFTFMITAVYLVMAQCGEIAAQKTLKLTAQ